MPDRSHGRSTQEQKDRRKQIFQNLRKYYEGESDNYGRRKLVYGDIFLETTLSSVLGERKKSRFITKLRERENESLMDVTVRIITDIDGALSLPVSVE